MEMVSQDTNNIISQHQEFNRDIYQLSGMGSQSSQSFHATVPQQIGYNQSAYEECILPTPKISRDINHVDQRERQSTYSNENIYENSVMYNSSDNQEIRTPSSLVFIETPAHSNRDYHSSVYSDTSIIPQSYQHDIRSNSPHVVIENTPVPNSCIQPTYQDSKASTSSSHEIKMKYLTPQAIVNQGEREPFVNDF